MRDDVLLGDGRKAIFQRRPDFLCVSSVVESRRGSLWQMEGGIQTEKMLSGKALLWWSRGSNVFLKM